MKWRILEKKEPWFLNEKLEQGQSETDNPKRDFGQLKKRKTNSNDERKTYSKHQIKLTGKIE